MAAEAEDWASAGLAPGERKVPPALLTLLAGIFLSIFLGGASLLRHHYREELDFWRQRQASLVADRLRNAENWVSERRDDARDFSSNPAFLAAARGGPAALKAAAAELGRLRGDHAFQAMCLYLPGGRTLSAPGGDPRLCAAPGDRDFIAQTGSIQIRLAGQSPADTVLGFATPLRAGRPGALAFWVSPRLTLFADLASEAVPTRTGETVLVYRDTGRGEAVFLSPLRFRPAGAPRLRRPLSDPATPASLAVTGRRVFDRLRDYRGERVLASTDRMPSTGWGIVHKLDLSEAMAGFRRMAALAVLAALGLAGTLCGLVWAFWQKRSELWLAERNSHLLRALADSSRISRLNRIYTVLSDVNHAIVRARGRQHLVDEVCRVTADSGGFPVVWIGFITDPGGRVEPAARAGRSAASWARHWVSTHDVPEGRGLSGRAMREGHPVVVKDVLEEAGMSPWHSFFRRAGVRSGAAFPLSIEGKVAGVFSIAAAEVGFFDEIEVRLLAELAMDVSFALEKHEQEARRREAEEALRTERNRLETVTRHLGVGLAIIGRDHHTIWANSVMEGFFGDLVGKPFRALHAPLSEAGDGCGVEEVLAGAGERIEREQTVRTQDGQRLWFESAASPLRDPGGSVTAVLLAVIPITQRKALEEELRQAQKMEAVGRLAGGVAHDFNNLLTAIRGYAELLAEDLSQDQKRQRDAREIMLAADRASALTRQLLAFSRKQVLAPQVISINETIAGLDNLLRRTLGEHIRLEVELAPGLGLVRVDPGQMEQVIINLAVNARDAMPQGGTLTIATCDIAVGAGPHQAHPDLKPGPAVLLEVADTGAGMDEQTLSRTFEPFFTTKAKGRGTGLGLSTVFGIVKQSGGDIAVESQPGQGATFRIFLPRCTDKKSPGPPPEAAAAPRGSETVLVVEDEAAVRALAGRILRRQGYRVLLAGGGQEALDKAQSVEGPLHLLVSDVIMPGLSGPQLAARLQVSRAGLKVLYISGYADEAVMRHGVLGKGVAFLHKPFTRAGLLRKVRETLDSPALVRRV